MSAQPPSFFARLSLALRVLGDAPLAQLVLEAAARGALPAPSPAAAPAAAKAPSPAASPAEASREGALHLLALLQREARLLDFCEEELTGYGDAVIGAAARTVHSGVRKVLATYFSLQAVRSEKEGEGVTVPPGFDAHAIRLTGNVTGSPPFKGALRHHGWRAVEVKLPEPVRGEGARVLAPAEVELP
jgi:Domain of unknown function (DUF2760)